MKRSFLIGALFTVAVIVLASRWVGGGGMGVTWEEAPPEIHGVWTTTNARYAGRAIEVGAGSVTLRRGDGGASVAGRIDIVRERFDNEQRVLRVEYQTEVGPDALDMVLIGELSMHLATQPDLMWTVSRPADWVPAAPPVFESEPLGFPALPLMVAFLVTGALVVLARGLIRGSPQIIRGVWTTQDPRFSGQSIRIRSAYFSHFAEELRAGGRIQSVRQWRDDADRVFNIEYQSLDGSREISISIDPAGHMRVRDGSKSVWVKR